MIDIAVERRDFFGKFGEKRRQLEFGVVFGLATPNCLKIAKNAFRHDTFHLGDGPDDMVADRFQGGEVVRRSWFGAVKAIHHGTDAVEKRLADVVIDVEKFIVAWHGILQ